MGTVSNTNRHTFTGHSFSRKARLCKTLGAVYLSLACATAQAESTVVFSLADFNTAVAGTFVQLFATSPNNIGLANEEAGPAGVNDTVGTVKVAGEGRSLTFDRANTGLFANFDFTALEPSDPAFLTFDDDEGAGNLADFDNALSPGDIDNAENDDWRVRILDATRPLRGFAFTLRDNNNNVGEVIRLFGADGALLDEIVLGSQLGKNQFIGVVGDQPFTEIRYDEDAGGDDIAVANFFFAPDPAPTAKDVFSATQANTGQLANSAVVVLDGADVFADPLSYEVISGPTNGVLTDPANGNSPVTAGTSSGQTLTYTPNANFTGIDSFSYRASDGSRSSDTKVATITVFEALRPAAKQIGSDIDGETNGERSGDALALSRDGTTLVVGAPVFQRFDSDAGRVRVHRFDGADWVQWGDDILGWDRDAGAGSAVAVSENGETLAIGAPGASSSGGPRSGNTRIYDWDQSAWQLRGTTIDGDSAGDESGTAVALSSDGNIVAIGAPFNDDSAFNAGHARVFRWDGNTWRQLGSELLGEGQEDESGIAVSLSGDGQVLAVGAWLNSDSAVFAGHVRVFRWNGSDWMQLGEDIDAESVGDRFGESLALSTDGVTIAVGGSKNMGKGVDAGYVRILRWDGSRWLQQGDDIDGEAEFDRSGSAVSLAGNGETVAIGAPRSNGGGFNRGQTQVFRWVGERWQQVGTDIDGESNSDGSGRSVSLSGDGQRLAIGTGGNEGEASNAGHVRVFDLSLSADDDEDEDGVANGVDDCDDTPPGEVAAINGAGCGPSERDSDNDGVNDAEDAFPNDPTETADSDGDGLGDNLEAEIGSNPNLIDSDNDGYDDKDEFERDTNPADAGDFPQTRPLWLLLVPALME